VEQERFVKTGRPLPDSSHNVSVYYLDGPLFFAASRRLVEFVEQLDNPQATLILSIRGVPLVDATGVEVLRELWQRQHKGGGDLLLSSLNGRVQTLLQRSGFLTELGEARVFWSADQAIVSLGAKLQPVMGQSQTADSPLTESVLMAPFAEKME
jgi:SulP family sulfate permease